MAKGAADAAAAHHRGRFSEGGGAAAALYGERPRDAGASIVVFFVDLRLVLCFVLKFYQNRMQHHPST